MYFVVARRTVRVCLLIAWSWSVAASAQPVNVDDLFAPPQRHEDPFNSRPGHPDRPSLPPTDDDMGGEIYGTAAAKELVREARKFDPMLSQVDLRDRDKAARLYERAIDAQPGAKINAQLANRIAQMYAFNEDRARGITTNRELARWWWERCLEMTNPRQLLWAQALMGLNRYDEILGIDASQIELDDWRTWPQGDSAKATAIRRRERDRLRQRLVNLQSRVAIKKKLLEEQLAQQGRVVGEPRPPTTSIAAASPGCATTWRRCAQARRHRCWRRCRAEKRR
jgi:hypothetical protein